VFGHQRRRHLHDRVADDAFLLPAATPLVRFWRTGGPAMPRMTGGSPDHSEHEHAVARMHN
jgi:hypothetical protein